MKTKVLLSGLDYSQKKTPLIHYKKPGLGKVGISQRDGEVEGSAISCTKLGVHGKVGGAKILLKERNMHVEFVLQT